MALPVEETERTTTPPGLPITATRLLEMSPAELDALFGSSPAGPIPVGRGAGTVIALPGTEVCKPLVKVLRAIAWQGKVFDPRTRDLRNLVTPFGIAAVRAEVSQSQSWVDGGECVLLDYSRSSRV